MCEVPLCPSSKLVSHSSERGPRESSCTPHVLRSGFRFQGSGFRVQGSGFRVQVLGFRVHNFKNKVTPIRASPSAPQKRIAKVTPHICVQDVGSRV